MAFGHLGLGDIIKRRWVKQCNSHCGDRNAALPTPEVSRFHTSASSPPVLSGHLLPEACPTGPVSITSVPVTFKTSSPVRHLLSAPDQHLQPDPCLCPFWLWEQTEWLRDKRGAHSSEKWEIQDQGRGRWSARWDLFHKGANPTVRAPFS